MQRARVDFPQPDSPTIANVSPRSMEKLTPSTARMTDRLPRQRPSNAGDDTWKYRARPRTPRIRLGIEPAGDPATFVRNHRGCFDAFPVCIRTARAKRAAAWNGL